MSEAVQNSKELLAHIRKGKPLDKGDVDALLEDALTSRGAGESFLTQEEVNRLLEGVTGPYDREGVQSMEDWCEAICATDGLTTIPNLDPLREAYQASWVRHPYEWRPSSGHIDEVDGRFLALAFNMMHLLIAGAPKPFEHLHRGTAKASHEGAGHEKQCF